MKHFRNITRFTYELTSFQGWRVSICRHNTHFTRYFPDKQYGSAEEALIAALEMRNSILKQLSQGEEPAAIFELKRHSEQLQDYPRGLRPKKSADL